MKRTFFLILTILVFTLGCKNMCKSDAPVDAKNINEDNALDMADKLLEELESK